MISKAWHYARPSRFQGLDLTGVGRGRWWPHRVSPAKFGPKGTERRLWQRQPVLVTLALASAVERLKSFPMSVS